VKWCNLDYNGSTLEEESGDQDMLDAIQTFSERHLIAKKRELSEQMLCCVVIAGIGNCLLSPVSCLQVTRLWVVFKKY
jgi:hypothetical protein